MQDSEIHNESPCARCSAETGGCCKVMPENRQNGFPLSVHELERLLPFAHLATDGPFSENQDDSFAPDAALAHKTSNLRFKDQAPSIAVTEENTPVFIQLMHALVQSTSSRVTDVFPNGAKHFRLKTRADGFCVFIGPEGCRLPRDIRPWYCRIFPVWVVRREITLFIPKDCHIAQMAKTPLHALSLLGATRTDIYSLHNNLLKDWNLFS